MSTIRIYLYELDAEVEIRCHKEVCWRCDGEGTHMNPNVDGNGISADEWWHEWDDESREMYLTGGYDVTCEQCKGLRVLDVPDENDPHYEAWVTQQQEDAAYAAERAAEMRMGA